MTATDKSQVAQHQSNRRAVLTNRGFTLLFCGQVTSQFGDGIYTVAIMWLMYLLTQHNPRSSLWMALVPVAATLPKIVVSPLAGVLVDRWRKRQTMILSDIIRSLVVAVIALLVGTHWVKPWELVVLGFILAVVSTVFLPAQAVLIKQIVASEQLVQANSLRSTANNVMQIVAPAVAGLLLASQVGLATAFWIDALTFLASVVTLAFIRADEPSVTPRPLTMETVYGDLREGWRSIFQFQYTKVLTPYVLIFNFALTAVENVLIYLYVAKVMHQSAEAVGAINSALAVGQVVGGLTLTVVSNRMAKEKAMTAGMVVTAFSIAAVGLFPSVWVCAALFFVGGFCMVIVNVSFFSRIQGEVPAHSLGRVWALLGAVFNGAIPLSNLVFGGLAAVVPVGILITLLGLLGSAAGIAAYLNPLVRRPAAPPASGAQA